MLLKLGQTVLASDFWLLDIQYFKHVRRNLRVLCSETRHLPGRSCDSIPSEVDYELLLPLVIMLNNKQPTAEYYIVLIFPGFIPPELIDRLPSKRMDTSELIA